jgi:hypothetical protein
MRKFSIREESKTRESVRFQTRTPTAGTAAVDRDLHSPLGHVIALVKIFRSFYVFPLVDLNQLVYCLWKLVHWLKSYFGGYFDKKSPVAPLA